MTYSYEIVSTTSYPTGGQREFFFFQGSRVDWRSTAFAQRAIDTRGEYRTSRRSFDYLLLHGA